MAKSLSLNDIKSGLYIEARERQLYVDGKVTDKLENVIIILTTKAGEIQVVLPPAEGKADEFNRKYSFGDVLEIETLAAIEDIRISIYKDELRVKFIGTYIEEESL